MATLQDVLALFRSLVASTRDEMELFNKNLPLFNAGQRALWKILTSREPMSNWFVVSSQATTPTNPDYFGPLVLGTREYTLPTNFHHLRLIECVTSEYEHTKFIKGAMDSQSFKDVREYLSTDPWGAEILYDIIGVNPGKIMFAQYPPAALELKLWYGRTPTVLTARTDSLNDFPIEAPEMIAQWSAMKFLVGAQPADWRAFQVQWQADIEQMVFGESRDNTAPIVVEGFLE